MTTTTDRPALMVEHHDPRALLIDLNIRACKPDKGLIDSIRDLGVLQPVIGYRTIDGQVRVRHGHRRTLAAIEAGLDAIPVIVIAAEADGADVDRILGQLDENTCRAGLTAADQAGVVTGLLDLGLTAGDITRRTRLPKGAVECARAVRASKTATAAAAKHTFLNLDQAAAIAEFDADSDAVKTLVDAAGEGDGTWRHTVARLRADKAEAEARAELVATLKADGVTIADRWPPWEDRLENLTTADGKKMRPAGHRKCPGHAAYLQNAWSDKGPAFKAVYFCADPRANGHKKTSGGSSDDAKSAEDAKAERAATIAGNKKWRTAETVRRQWLTEFLARQAAPKDAIRFIIESLARADTAVRTSMEGYSGVHATARELLRLPVPPPGSSPARNPGVAKAAQQASASRAEVIGLALILGAYEGSTGVHIWRTPKSYAEIARYLAALASWGYGLSDAEQAIVDACECAPGPVDDEPDGDHG